MTGWSICSCFLAWSISTWDRLRVSDRGLEILARCPHLTRLTLDGTNISDAGLVRIAEMDSLEWLSLRETRATEAGVRALKKRRPATQGRHDGLITVTCPDKVILEETSMSLDDGIDGPPCGAMTDDAFWELISLLDHEKLGDDDAVVRPVVDALRRRAPGENSRVRRPACREVARASTPEARCDVHMGRYAFGRRKERFSPDLFLYARCAVIAGGREAYEQVMANPKGFPKDLEFEAILSIAATAFREATGEEYTHVTATDYETFQNRQGWPGLK